MTGPDGLAPRTIRARAPLRLGLAGGGSDVKPYCDEFGGAVLNATIDKYAYASVAPASSPTSIELHSPDRRRTGHAALVDLGTLIDDFPLHVGVYQRMIRDYNDGRPLPLRLTTQVDAPPGSGLGSSSTVVVVLIAVIAEALRVSLSSYDIAELAWSIEREDLGLAGGWQDHYAAAFGGFNFLESDPGGRVVVNPLRIRRHTRAELEASLLLYFGGVSRDSAEVIGRQQENVRNRATRALEATHTVKQEARNMKQHLLMGDIAAMSDCLSQGWEAKKRLAPGISTDQIDRAFEVAASCGMRAGKISGAGGGGFMMMIVDPERRHEVMRRLEEECGGQVSTCHFTHAGVEVWDPLGHDGLRLS